MPPYLQLGYCRKVCFLAKNELWRFLKKKFFLKKVSAKIVVGYPSVCGFGLFPINLYKFAVFQKKKSFFNLADCICVVFLVGVWDDVPVSFNKKFNEGVELECNWGLYCIGV